MILGRQYQERWERAKVGWTIFEQLRYEHETGQYFSYRNSTALGYNLGHGMNTPCESCATRLEFDTDELLLFCGNEDCDEFGTYPEIIACIDCGSLAAENPAQRCEDCQRKVMMQSYTIYFPKGKR